jgi:hypothetical protein
MSYWSMNDGVAASINTKSTAYPVSHTGRTRCQMWRIFLLEGRRRLMRVGRNTAIDSSRTSMRTPYPMTGHRPSTTMTLSHFQTMKPIRAKPRKTSAARKKPTIGNNGPKCLANQFIFKVIRKVILPVIMWSLSQMAEFFRGKIANHQGIIYWIFPNIQISKLCKITSPL